jgi:hypothetical protein
MAELRLPMSIAFPWNWERWSSTEKAAAPAPRPLPSHNDKLLRLVAVPTIAGSVTAMTTVGLIAHGDVDQAVGAREAGAGAVSRRPSTSAHAFGPPYS